MLVTNKTNVDIIALGKTIKPNESGNFVEMMHNILNIHSNIGSCIITTEYGNRSFKNFGELVAHEVDKKSVIITSDN